MRSFKRIVDNALRARREYGVSVLRQFCDIIRLSRGRGRLGASEYYDYRLFDEHRFSHADKRRFLGWRAEAALEHLLIASAQIGQPERHGQQAS